jgi:CubicO group peptidase (beta-lactamase class C family)
VVAAAGRGDVTLATWVAGQADTLPGLARPSRSGTVFDLASLTKVVATTTVILALADRGQLALDAAAAGFLPDFTALRQGPVTITHLLTHTSGLPDTRRFDQSCESAEQLWPALHAVPLQAPPGTRVAYSDLGFLALGEIAAAAGGRPLDDLMRDLVTGPLGMAGTGFCPLDPPLAVPPGQVAVTEPRGDGTAWTGIVHDENARLLGGVAGHAGLFAPAADLARFAAWWVSEADGPVSVPLRRAAARCQTAGRGGRRGLGWVCAGDGMDITGGTWGPAAVSHTGFTGTSLALDPASGGWLVLLTNAVHFGRDHRAIRALRRDVHAAAAPWLAGR